MNVASQLVPLQARVVRPLADAAEHSPWVPKTLSRGLRRIDGTCAIDRSGAAPRCSQAVTVRHPIAARLYAKQAVKAEQLGLAARRTQLLASLSGRVIEIGAGTGANFAHYPEAVDEVVALEPEAHLRGLAERAVAGARVPVRVIDATAESLPFADEEFDAAVASLVLCSVDDPASALQELYRVLAPGGVLQFNEHVLSRSQRVARLQRAADRCGWPLIAGGCHLARDTETLIGDAGFEVVSLERYSFGIPPLDPPKPHIIGIARKPAIRQPSGNALSALQAHDHYGGD